MSSGWTRRSVCMAPLPFGWKLCFKISPKISCLTVNVLGEALALGAVELELEHPAIPSRPAATTVTPSQVPARKLKMFTRGFVRLQGDAQRSGVEGAVERLMASKRPNSKIRSK